MQNNYFKTKTIFCLALLFFYFNSNAQLLPPCYAPSAYQELDINNVRARFWASGSMWFDPNSHNPNYEVPKGEGIHSLFAFDLWMGATDAFGQKRLDWQTYGGQALTENSYYPGPLDEMGNTTIDDCLDYDRVWKINKSELDSFRSGFFSESEIPKDILEWPAKDNPHIPFSLQRDLAPFVDVNGDNRYNPLQGDYPEIMGDQALWWVFNDNGHREYIGFPPLQMEVQVMAYAYNALGLRNHTFYKYTFTNKSGMRLDDVMLGLFVDADLGQFDDDLAGCDTLRNMGIIYNGDAQDGNYGIDIPMAAIKILRGPQKEDGTYSEMYTFWHRNGFGWWDIPNSKQSACYALWGLSSGGTMMTYGGNGHGSEDGPPTLYMFPSDPTDENGWSECSFENTPSSDRHFFMGTDPFTLQPNQRKELHFAALWVRDNFEHPCPSFAPIQQAADYVQALFDTGLMTNIEEQPFLATAIETPHLQLFPNPLKENRILTLQFQQQNFNSTLQKGTFQLYDNLGRLVKSVALKGERETQLQLSELQSGIYFYRLRWENGGVENGKLVVE